MLAKKFRLPVEKWIKDKNKKIASKKSDFFILKTNPNNLGFNRFGVVISSKVYKSSVKRNQLKRTIFDFIRLKKLYEVSNKNSGRDFLIIVLPPVVKLTKEKINKELKNFFYNE